MMKECFPKFLAWISFAIILGRKVSATSFPSNCVSTCEGKPDGNYQSCFGCGVYASCVGNRLHDNRSCPANLLWDNVKKLCDYTSGTCTPGVYECPKDLPYTTSMAQYGRYCYQFVNKEMNWDDALSRCRLKGGTLVTINDEATNQFIVSTLNSITSWENNGVWIGLHDKTIEQTWQWMTEDIHVQMPLKWTNWDSKEPSGMFHSLNDCVRMHRGSNTNTWKWRETRCKPYLTNYKFICQYVATYKWSPTTKITTPEVTTVIKPTKAFEQTTASRAEATLYTELSQAPETTTFKLPSPNELVAASTQNNPSSNNMTFVIAGAVAGAVLLAVIIAILVTQRRKRQKRDHLSSTKVVAVWPDRRSLDGPTGGGCGESCETSLLPASQAQSRPLPVPVCSEQNIYESEPRRYPEPTDGDYMEPTSCGVPSRGKGMSQAGRLYGNSSCDDPAAREGSPGPTCGLMNHTEDEGCGGSDPSEENVYCRIDEFNHDK